jgi:hypothetical protein
MACYRDSFFKDNFTFFHHQADCYIIRKLLDFIFNVRHEPKLPQGDLVEHSIRVAGVMYHQRCFSESLFTTYLKVNETVQCDLPLIVYSSSFILDMFRPIGHHQTLESDFNLRILIPA